MKLVRISAELVTDLHLERFCERYVGLGWGDWFFIDRRRYKREMRRMDKLRRTALQRFMASLPPHRPAQWQNGKCFVGYDPAKSDGTDEAAMVLVSIEGGVFKVLEIL